MTFGQKDQESVDDIENAEDVEMTEMILSLASRYAYEA